MEKRVLGKTGLQTAPLVFGGNVFGWTVDERASFELLDALFDSGLNAIDTADIYSAWADGNEGGESETIIGKWLQHHPGKRDDLILITKVGGEFSPSNKGLSQRWIAEAVENSLRRLNTDYIDLYLSHWPDPDTPYEETLAAYQKLIEAGKVRAIGASNHDAEQLREALGAAQAAGLPSYQALQPEYNLYDRDKFEGPLQEFAMQEDLGVITYFSLASGFLSGKYRSTDDLSKSARGGRVANYLNPRGMQILDALDQVSERSGASPAEIALAWTMAQDGVTAPIASATTLPQLESLVRATELVLSADDLALLNEASR